jgi:hypothetical protein
MHSHRQAEFRRSKMFTCSKITYLYHKKIITEQQHHWILFVKNEIEKKVSRIRTPQLLDGKKVFRLLWYFEDVPDKMAIVDFYPSGFWKVFVQDNFIIIFEQLIPDKYISNQFLDFLQVYAETKNS